MERRISFDTIIYDPPVIMSIARLCHCRPSALEIWLKPLNFGLKNDIL